MNASIALPMRAFSCRMLYKTRHYTEHYKGPPKIQACMHDLLPCISMNVYENILALIIKSGSGARVFIASQLVLLGVHLVNGMHG